LKEDQTMPLSLKRSLPHSLPFLLIAGFLLAASADAQLAVKTWRRWEWTLTATGSYPAATNFYRDARIKIDFYREPLAAGAAATYSGYGFWDGGSTFRVRTPFPSTGDWTFRTSCTGVTGCSADSGLNLARDAVNRKVVVTASAGGHPLWGQGFLKVQDNPGDLNAGRFLVHRNAGLPFFWLGDTAWAGPLRATQADWEDYVYKLNPTTLVATNPRNRKDMGFTVLQIALPVDWMRLPAELTANGQPKDASGQAPFVQSAGCTGPIPNSCSSWNPSFWTAFDDKVNYANSQGLVVALVGLAERLQEASGSYPAMADLQTYARNVAARLAGNFVVFSPTFDRAPDIDPDTCGTNACTAPSSTASCRMRCIAEEIRRTSPCLPAQGITDSCHLVTNHWAGSLDPAAMQPFQDQGWLDFQMPQSGQGGNNGSSPVTSTAVQLQLLTNRARTLPDTLWGYSPIKPIVNGESIYDGACHKTLGTQNYNAYRARQTGYLSMLSGATGYTFGVMGVFEWGRDSGNPLCPDAAWRAISFDWRVGLNRSSSPQMKVLATIFRSVAFDRLVPDPNLIANNQLLPGSTTIPLPDEKKMVLARDVNHQFLLAYLPDNPAIRIETAGLPGFAGWIKEWIDPRSGAVSAATCTPLGVSTIYKCDRPGTAIPPGEGPDWVLRVHA
jgi:hypothetical protein